MEMDCRTADHCFEDYLDGLLEEATRDGFQQHVAVCPDCRNRLRDEQNFREALRSMPVPMPDPDFAACAFERAAAAIRRPWINFPAMRIAASILVIIALGFMFKGNLGSDRSEWPEAFVSRNQPEEIRLVFYSRQNLDNVTLRLEPPEGVELVGFEDRREIVWQTDLVQGENLLVLPVIVRNREGGSLIAEIRHGNQNKQFGLKIRVLRSDGPRPGAARLEDRMVSTTT